MIAASPLALDAAAMLRKASRPRSENAAPQSARMSPAGDGGMADRHLQRHEPAIAVAEHDGLAAAGRLLHRLGHPVGDSGEAATDGLGAAEAGQFRNDHPERPRQLWDDGVETRPVRQQRVKQEQRRRFARSLAGSLAGLRRVDRAIGEKSVHAGLSLSSWVGGDPVQDGGRWRGPIDKSKFSLFKPLSLDVIFHDCKIGATISREISMLLRDNVYESLRADILTCRLAPGDDMREQELAERYAVSRQPVREALLQAGARTSRHGAAAPGLPGQSDLAVGCARPLALPLRAGAGLRRRGDRERRRQRA